MKATNILWIFSLILIGAFGVLQANADPEPEPAPKPVPEPAKAHRSAYFNEPANPRFRSVPLPVDIDDEMIAEFRQAEDADNVNADENAANVTPNKDDASSGRLFMKKFLLFKNIFGAGTSQQPVIPIIITGAGNTGNTATTPTTTITTTGTIPTATGTITTQPITGAREEAEEEPQQVDVQALQAALAANANEYVVTDQEIKGTSDSKASKQTQNINLRPQGAKNGQFITVRVPAKYRRYFKSGQKVMLNTNNRAGNRRVVKRRNNKNRRRVNRKNKNRLTH